MKFVSLLIAAALLSFSASAQSSGAGEKRGVIKIHQKARKQKIKPAAENTNVTTLTDEKSHKAKWTFEEMLKRRLEVDAEDAKKARPQEMN